MSPTTEYKLIPYDELFVKSNVREDVGDVSELAASIAELGLSTPLLVEPSSDGYNIIAGHRRHAALGTLGWSQPVPCMVRTVDDADFLALQIVENLQRLDLNPIDEAKGYRRLMDDCGASQAEVAAKVSKHQSHISRRLSLLSLDGKLQRMVATNQIPVEWGELLARVEDPDDVQRLLDQGLSEWNIRNTLDRQERDAAIAKMHEAGVKAGLPMADTDEVRLYATTGETFKTVAAARKHSFGEDERLVARMDYSGKVVLAIYEPKSTKGRDSSDPAVAARAAERHRRKVEREVHAQIVESLVPIIAKPKKAVVDSFAVKAVVDLNLHTYAKDVCELLNLEVEVVEAPLGRKERDFTGTARNWAEQGDTELRQTALAIVIAATRNRMVNDAGLVGEVEAFLAQHEVPSRDEVRLKVEAEFAEADAEKEAKRAERDAKRAAKEAEAAAAAEDDIPDGE